ncbi:Nucleotide-diphospho-sugar transferase [Sesbania bispinosa]|nr:Nucleotide-diphospho-sugar transferase [Sesbania bispinosa]
MTMAKQNRARSLPNPNSVGGFHFFRGILFILLLWALWSSRNQLTLIHLGPTINHPPNRNTTTSDVVLDPPEKTFYDDPQLSYSIEKPLKNWDEKRSEWLRLHPQFAAVERDRILLITGSQPSPCKNSIGDHLLLRCFKNKVDYCRIHGIEVLYNNLHLHPKMGSYWAKLPVIRSAMLAHPEVEWIWWMDADAVFTDMEFKLPLERYKAHNLVVHGWANLVYDENNENKSWTGLNAGSFLIRNCQWQRRKWGGKTYLEGGYDLEGYWVAVKGRFEGIKVGYDKMEEEVRSLRRRHAEKLTLWYGELREGYLRQKERRPFVTHFTGCQPCSGDHNPSYDGGGTCWKEMERALNFADNQVLRNYGFVRKDLLSSSVYEVPFD